MVEPELAVLRRLRPLRPPQVVAVDPVEDRLGEGCGVVDRQTRFLEQGREHLLRRQVHVDPAVHVHRRHAVAPLSQRLLEVEQQSGLTRGPRGPHGPLKGQEPARRGPDPSRRLCGCEPALHPLGGVGDARLGGIRALEPAPLVERRQDVEVGARHQRAAQHAQHDEKPEHHNQRDAGLARHGAPRAHRPASPTSGAVRVRRSTAPAPSSGHVMRTRISMRRCSPTRALVTA